MLAFKLKISRRYKQCNMQMINYTKTTTTTTTTKGLRFEIFIIELIIPVIVPTI